MTMTATVENRDRRPATGRVARVIGPVVDVEFPAEAMPEIYYALHVDITFGGDTRTLTLEVEQHIGDNMVRAISMQPTDGLVRGAEVTNTGAPISVPVGDVTKGHVFNVLGEPLDVPTSSLEHHRAVADPPARAAARPARVEDRDVRHRHQGHRPAHPVRPRRQDRPVRRRRRRQDRAHPGDDPPGRARTSAVSPCFAGVGERTREGNDLFLEMTESGVIEDTALVFGQMDEPPGTRLRVALSALTMAEYFRDVQKQDVLLFIDNIFRFTQAGSEVSTLLGRMPSAVGYQPTLADEMGQLQERITSTRGHSITSMQAIYVPADDITDPAPHTAFAHLDATTVLSRAITEKGIYPAVDPLDSTSRILDPRYIGQEHYNVAARPCSRSCSGTRSCRTSSRSSASTSCPRRTRSPSSGPGASSGSCPSRCTSPSSSPASPACSSRSRRRSPRSRRSRDGKYDNVPEQAFFMCGGIEDVERKAKELERS